MKQRQGRKVIIFVHGVMGDMDNTWINRETHSSWPDMIAGDPALADYDVYVYGYQSPCSGDSSNINEIAGRFSQQLQDDNFFSTYEELYFITHSMGGLITKRMLVALNASDSDKLQRVRSVLFIAVPASGANVATIASWLSTNPQFKNMDPRSAQQFLQSIEQDWANVARKRTPEHPFPRSFVAYETRNIAGVKVVPALFTSQTSDLTPIAFDYDHITIVKPDSPSNDVYRWARQRILESSGLSINSNDMASSTMTPLTGHPGVEWDSSISPDGRDVAYSWVEKDGGTRSIYVQRIGSGEPQRLTADADGDVESPTWSYDGQRIYYVHPVADKDEIWVMASLNGTGKRNLSFAPRTPDLLGIHPGIAVSPDGTLAIPSGGSKGSRGPFEGPPGVFLHLPSRSDWHRLTNADNNDFADYQPSFSPDGKELAFVCSASLGKDSVCVVPVTGGPAHHLTDEAEHISGIAWTPSGREIVFVSDRGGTTGLRRVSKLGGTPQTISASTHSLANLSISRQLNRLVFVEDSSNTSIWERTIAPSSDPTHDRTAKLIYSAGGDDSPRYSPDGKKIVFVSTRTGSSEIWMCKSDGSEQVALTGASANASDSVLKNASGPVTGSPRWSPNGKQIVFDSRKNASGHSKIYLMDADGTNMHALPVPEAEGPVEDAVPSWSVDGQWILFASTRSGQNEIWKAKVSGGDPVQITRGGGFAPLPSEDGKSVYFVKDPNTPEIWQASVNGGQGRKIIDNIGTGLWGQWTATGLGIYFVKRDNGKKYGIDLFRIRGQRTEQVFSPLADTPPLWSEGLAVSPDLRTILYTRKQARSQIILVQGFH